MKVYYDEETDNIIVGNLNRMFSNGSLEAVINGDIIDIKYKNIDFIEVSDHYSKFKNKYGLLVGVTVENVKDYLNTEFNKTKPSGEENFTLLSIEKQVDDERIKAGDDIVVMTNSLNDNLVVTTVGAGFFIVSRIALNTISGLTSGLGFKWKKI